MCSKGIRRYSRRVGKGFWHMIGEGIGDMVRNGLLGLIRLYQFSLASFFGPCCRFEPSCSHYAALSIQRFGIVEGCWRSMKRVVKCHPLNPGGYDPVPEMPAIDLQPKGN